LAKKSTSKKRKTSKKEEPKPVKKTTNKKRMPQKKVEVKPVKKRMNFLIPAVIFLCVIGIAVILLFPGAVEAESTAELVDIFGDVEVKQGDTWVTAENNMELHRYDSVRTGDNSSASIIIFKGSIIRLDSNTEVYLEELIQGEEGTFVTIEQEAGRTWSTVQKISGIDEYEVQTPTAVASVRGTSFDINIENGTTIVGVIKGSVDVKKTDNETVYTVLENYSVAVDSEEVGEPEDFDLDDWITNNLLKDEDFVDDIKDVLRERIEPYLDELRERVDIPDEDIEILIDLYVQGKFTIPPETPDHLKEIFDLS
jgi:hypothetical protein